MQAARLTLGTRIAQGRPQVALGLMLLALHAAVAWGITDLWSRAFLLAHMGLFLIWQPVWRGEGELDIRHVALIGLIGVLLVGAVNWWLIAVWIAVLFGLIGGHVPGIRERRHRLASLLAAAYLLGLLLVWVVPQLFSLKSGYVDALHGLVRFGLPLLPGAILLVRVERTRSDAPYAVDFFYSVVLFLLVAALVLGSIAIKQFAGSDYPIALAQTLIGIAVLLVALSWLWDPHGGFAGIGQLLSRYLLSVGLPFERWMQSIADHAEEINDAERFLAAAATDMLALPWVAGVAWRTAGGEGECGTRSRHQGNYDHGPLALTIYTRWSISPALMLHLKLLTRLLAHFHDAKRREQLQRQHAYTQAIYETGARLTHDVKNLLQSLTSLCAAAEGSGADRAVELQALMQRQLPQITQRLQATLDKLKAPDRADENVPQVDARVWWEALKGRYAGRGVGFREAVIAEKSRLPGELFDSVAENLLQNALAKARTQPGTEIEVSLSCESAARLVVRDSGSPVSPGVAKQLFDGPVPSQMGLGIGLYQASRQARALGYRLSLAVNRPGEVCFELGPG